MYVQKPANFTSANAEHLLLYSILININKKFPLRKKI